MNRTQQAARLALRQRRAAVPRATRKYATQPPPPAGQPAPNFNKKDESGISGGLIGLIALTGAAAGAWYYYGQDDHAQSKEAQELKGKASETGQAARDYSQHVKAVGEKEIDKLRAQGNEQLADARVRAQAESANARDYIGEAQRTAEQKYADAKQYASQTADAASRKYGETKDAAAAKYDEARDTAATKYGETRNVASAKISDAKASVQEQYAHARAEAERAYGKLAGSAEDAKHRAEGTYYDAKGRAEGAYGEAKGAAEEKKDEAKAGWFSWLGWGRSKVDDAKEEARWKKDAVKHDAAEGVEEKSSGLAAWASGKKAETVQEKDGNVRRAGSYTSSV